MRLRGLHKERLPGSSGLVMRSELCTGGEREAPGGNDLPRGRGEDLETGGVEAHSSSAASGKSLHSPVSVVVTSVK